MDIYRPRNTNVSNLSSLKLRCTIPTNFELCTL